MADRFSLLPDDIQDYIFKLALNKILSEHYFQRINKIINKMELAITLLKYLGGPSDSNPDYSLPRRLYGYLILDFNNPYVLNVLSYATEYYNPNFSKYFNVDNDWWQRWWLRCYFDIETTLEELETSTHVDANWRNFPSGGGEFLEFRYNLTCAWRMVNRIYFKYPTLYPPLPPPPPPPLLLPPPSSYPHPLPLAPKLM